ncbi:Uncharacterised protein [Escherichia coli]|uniref:Uncharacterized protein n=1 Tax=Escherichia coli TaxID=562 RepID=A0A377K6K9_ECOLX|nr:Uncharacterised protein [Escherichia coli]
MRQQPCRDKASQVKHPLPERHYRFLFGARRWVSKFRFSSLLCASISINRYFGRVQLLGKHVYWRPTTLPASVRDYPLPVRETHHGSILLRTPAAWCCAYTSEQHDKVPRATVSTMILPPHREHTSNVTVGRFCVLKVRRCRGNASEYGHYPTRRPLTISAAAL